MSDASTNYTSHSICGSCHQPQLTDGGCCCDDAEESMYAHTHIAALWKNMDYFLARIEAMSDRVSEQNAKIAELEGLIDNG